MSGQAGHRKRLISVTAANLRSKHLYLTGHFDFFPADCFGRSISAEPGKLLRLDVDGLNDPIWTDIPTDADSGSPRAFFRKRTWVGQFYAKHNLRPGDSVCLEKIGPYHFRVKPYEQKHYVSSVLRNASESTLSKSSFRVIELFAGCGGLALGFKAAGFDTVLANEWDAAACKTIEANITDRVMNCPIQQIVDFPEADVVAGGPPCQGFSNLGERVPKDPRNQLWRQFFRCVEQVNPRAFLLENVPPLLKSAEYLEMIAMSKRLGYTVESAVLNSADYGVPQTRKRAILLGMRDGEPTLPMATHGDPTRRSLLTTDLIPWLTVRDAIGHLPLIPTGENWHIGRNPTEMSLRRYHCIPPGGNRWDLPDELMPDCWKRKLSGGTDLFGRLWWNRPSVTIRTEFYKPEKGRYLHPSADRPITHLEASLLQSFPENYDYRGSKIQVGVQIGNAVPPRLATALAVHIRELISAGIRRPC